MFFVLCADRCFLVSQKQADNETSGCLSDYRYHTTSSSSVSTIAFDAFSSEMTGVVHFTVLCHDRRRVACDVGRPTLADRCSPRCRSAYGPGSRSCDHPPTPFRRAVSSQQTIRWP